MRVALALLAVWGCAGMACGKVECPSLAEGNCNVSFQRLLTDTAFSVQFPNGGGATYTSEPNQAGTLQLLGTVDRLSATVESLAAGRRPSAPRPTLPPVPEQPPVIPSPEDTDPSPSLGPAWRDDPALRVMFHGREYF